MLNLALLLLVATMGFSQDSLQQSILKENLADLEEDVGNLNIAISKYEDIELYDYELQEANNRISAFAISITKDSPLYEQYEECNRTFYQIEKRIEDLKNENYNMQKYNSLMDYLNNYLSQMSVYKADGERYVKKNMPDSLMMVKKKASNIYSKTLADAESNKEIVENDETLSQIYHSIEEYNFDIDSMKCNSKGQLYETIFRIVMVVFVLFMVINMLQSKLKAKKMAKTAKDQIDKMTGNGDTPML